MNCVKTDNKAKEEILKELNEFRYSKSWEPDDNNKVYVSVVFDELKVFLSSALDLIRDEAFQEAEDALPEQVGYVQRMSSRRAHEEANGYDRALEDSREAIRKLRGK